MNECENNVCPEHSDCRNMEGSYTCDCQRGFQSSGGVCIGKWSIIVLLSLKSVRLWNRLNFYKSYPCKKKKTGKALFRSMRVILNFYEMSALTIRPMFIIWPNEVKQIYSKRVLKGRKEFLYFKMYWYSNIGRLLFVKKQNIWNFLDYCMQMMTKFEYKYCPNFQ